MRLGVQVSFTARAHPETSGKNECFDGPLQAAVFRFEHANNVEACRKRFQDWRRLYNCERPPPPLIVSRSSTALHTVFFPNPFFHPMTRYTTLLATVLFALSSAILLSVPANAQDMDDHNTLTPEERADGWELLFDGETTDGWRGYNDDTFPDEGWNVEDGILTIEGSGGGVSGSGGDIVTTKKYDDFVLKLEWKISEGGNSGIFYRAIEQDEQPIYWSAPEMQVLDNANHPDATRGEDGNRKAGSLYDLIPAEPQTFSGHGEWQEVMVVAEGGHIEHWLNGEKVLEYEMWSQEWYRMIRNSKFQDHPEFGDAREGYIGLQDHGTTAHFRNIKIKEL